MDSLLYIWPPDIREKPAFWDSVTTISDNFACLWMCIGDLNLFLINQRNEEAGWLLAPPFALSRS
jgi:hypothetical protein